VFIGVNSYNKKDLTGFQNLLGLDFNLLQQHKLPRFAIRFRDHLAIIHTRINIISAVIFSVPTDAVFASVHGLINQGFD
jgi:hypothetical protein